MRSILKFMLAALAAVVVSCAAPEAGDGLQSLVIVTDQGERRFTIELADEPEERRIGLMNRESLAPDAGMLFDFGDEPQPVSMWMKNTLIPLDMAFIDENGVIRRIAANTTPRSLQSIRSGAPVVAVLEVNGGRLAELGVEEGDVVRHAMFND